MALRPPGVHGEVGPGAGHPRGGKVGWMVPPPPPLLPLVANSTGFDLTVEPCPRPERFLLVASRETSWPLYKSVSVL